MTEASSELQRFVKQSVVALTTNRRDGTVVSTPVNFAVEGDHGFIRTGGHTGKAKRLRNDSNVTLAPSTHRGQPTGPAISATARLLEGDEARRATRVIKAKHRIVHGVMVPLTNRLRGFDAVVYEITPSS